MSTFLSCCLESTKRLSTEDGKQMVNVSCLVAVGILWLVTASSVNLANASTVLQVKAPSSIRTDSSDKTFSLALLNLALSKSASKFPQTTIDVVNVENVVPGRLLNLLQQEKLDVIWSASSDDYQQNTYCQSALSYMLFITIPLDISRFNRN